MLSNLGIRSKLLAVLCVPMVFLVAVSALLVNQALDSARKADQVQQLTTASTDLVAFVHQLQLERGTTLAYLATIDPTAKQRLTQQRVTLDDNLRTLNTTIASSPLPTLSPALARAVAQVRSADDKINAERRAVDSGFVRFDAVRAYYDAAIQSHLNLLNLVSEQVSDASLTRALRNYSNLSQLIEYAAQERDLVNLAAINGSFTASEHAALLGVDAEQNALFTELQQQLTGANRATLAKAVADGQTSSYEDYLSTAQAALPGARITIGADLWEAVSSDRIAELSGVERDLGLQVGSTAGDIGSAAKDRAYIVAGLAVAGVLLALALVLVFSRRITAPLRRLTVAAEDLRGALPKMVEQMQTPGETSDLAVEPIAVSGRDEIGRLAEAFNSVNDVTVQVAQEQAALRGSIAETFVNVARRNQTLLGKQLSFLDHLESREENPDTLEDLFKLDHLAARMRRNAESLLVLAGIDATRRLRSPMALSDVVRTAIGEIESYDRVDLLVDDDPGVSGRHALAIAHLIAELVDNAAQFSQPDTRVEVSTSGRADGKVEVLVNDVGLGMSSEEINLANKQLADPPPTELAVAQRLGLYVVGRIAKRLGIAVSIRKRRTGGTAVSVTLPTTVLVGVAAAPMNGPAGRPLATAPTLPAAADSAVAEDGDGVLAAEGTGPVDAALPSRRTSMQAPAARIAPADPLDTVTPLAPGTPLLPAELSGAEAPPTWQPLMATEAADTPLVSRADAPLSPRRQRAADAAAKQAEATAAGADPAESPAASQPATERTRGRRESFFRRRADRPAPEPELADDEPAFTLPDADESIALAPAEPVHPGFADLLGTDPVVEDSPVEDGPVEAPVAGSTTPDQSATPAFDPAPSAPGTPPAFEPSAAVGEPWMPTFEALEQLSAEAAPMPAAAPPAQPAQPVASAEEIAAYERPGFAAELSALARDEQPARPAAVEQAPEIPATDDASPDTLNQLVEALGGNEQALAAYRPEKEELVALPAAQDILPQRGRAAKASLPQRTRQPKAKGSFSMSRRKGKGEQPAGEPVTEQVPVPIEQHSEQPLPTRAAASQPASQPAPYGDDLAFNALAELSQLSAANYEPGYTPSGGLTRRQPKAAVPVAVPEQRPHADRDAEQVRGRLSGFRAGVARGRSNETDTSPLIDSTTGKEGQQ